MRIIFTDPEGVFNFYFFISLVLRFSVNNQDLVVGENVAARVHAVLEIKNPSNLHQEVQISCGGREKRNERWLESEFKKLTIQTLISRIRVAEKLISRT